MTQEQGQVTAATFIDDKARHLEATAPAINDVPRKVEFDVK